MQGGDQWPNNLNTRYVTDPKNLTAERPALKNDPVRAAENMRGTGTHRA